MDKKQAIEKLNDIRCHVKETSAEEQALVMAIDALKQPVATDTNVGNNSEIPNSSDAISRQVAIDAIVQCTNCGDEDALRGYVLKHSLDNGWTGGILEALDAVKDLPTAQPDYTEMKQEFCGWQVTLTYYWNVQMSRRKHCWDLFHV